MISLNNIHVTFNAHTVLENHVLRGIEFKIETGEFVTVIGSNGAGKSTLLNIISGEVPIDSGCIIMNDRDVTQLAPHQRSQLVARVFQDPLAGTCADLSIEENLALANSRGVRRGLSLAITGGKQRALFKDHLARLGLGLENRLSDRMGLLSGGQRQAVSLLMAALQPMKILLLDEHTAALDPKTAAFVLKLTQEIVTEHRLTALMVTHSMRQALDVGGRTIMMDQGKIVFDVAGTKRKSMDIPDLLKLFETARGAAIEDDALLLG